jgi:DNA-binding MarR family transcriptional regulator
MTDEKDTVIQLDTFWPYQAVVLADQISRFTLATAKAEAGLNLSQWRVLAAIAEKPGRTAADVVTITPMDKTIVSRAVSSLIDAGLVLKKTETTDKRKSSLSVTALGKKHYQNIGRKLNAALIDKFGIEDIANDRLAKDTGPEAFTATLKQYIDKMKSGV